MTDTPSRLPQSGCLAAIDLGSNSFHLIITQVDQGRIRPIHTRSERVQLGEAADSGELTQAAIDRGLACLEQFKQLLDETAPHPIRVVGTHALRRAKNRRDFIDVEGGSPVNMLELLLYSACKEPARHNTFKLLGRVLMLQLKVAWLRWLSRRQR